MFFPRASVAILVVAESISAFTFQVAVGWSPAYLRVELDGLRGVPLGRCADCRATCWLEPAVNAAVARAGASAALAEAVGAVTTFRGGTCGR